MSRWTTPRSCANESASMSCDMADNICGSVSVALRLRYSPSPVPSTYSITMYAVGPSSPYS